MGRTLQSGWATGGHPTIQAAYDTGQANKAIAAMEIAGQERHWADQLALYRDILGQQQDQTGSLGGVVDQYNKAFAEAKAANEAKYKQALGLTDQVSGQQAADIRSQYTNQRSSALQNLARSGMSGTTVGATLSKGIAGDEQSALNRLSDQLLQQKLGVMQGFEYKSPESAVPTALINAMAPQYSFPSF